MERRQQLDLRGLFVAEGVRTVEELLSSPLKITGALTCDLIDRTPRGAVFVPFCYYEAAANKLTNPVLDPFGKIPEFKYCAVRVSKGGPTPVQASYGGGQAPLPGVPAVGGLTPA